MSRSSSESLSPRGRCRVCYRCGPGVFSMGKSDLCLAGAGGSTRASGSRGIPRKSFEAVRGTTAIDDVTVFDIIPGPELLVEQGCFPVVCKWRWQSASGSEGVLRKGPSRRSEKKHRWTMLFVLFRLRALKSPWNSETFPLAVAGGSMGPNGSEDVPRKFSETFRGTASVDDDLFCVIIAGRRSFEIAGELSCCLIIFRIPSGKNLGRRRGFW